MLPLKRSQIKAINLLELQKRKKKSPKLEEVKNKRKLFRRPISFF